MDNLRDNLVELLRNAKAAMKAENLSCDLARNMFVADYLLQNGVTVQDGTDTDVPTKWIPASEPPKDEDQRVLVWLSRSPYHQVRVDTDRFLDGKWVRWGKCVTHWTPICMPEPPKEG